MSDVFVNYLTNVKQSKTKMKMFLSNGVMLEGSVTDFDASCIILDKCMVMNDKIVSITPQK